MVFVLSTDILSHYALHRRFSELEKIWRYPLVSYPAAGKRGREMITKESLIQLHKNLVADIAGNTRDKDVCDAKNDPRGWGLHYGRACGLERWAKWVSEQICDMDKESQK